MNTSKLYAKVARDAWQEMNSAYREFNAENPEFDGDPELNLYVFADGSWTIDNPQYIPTTNGCISVVSIGLYNGPAELADEIESNEDWDAIGDEESDEE